MRNNELSLAQELIGNSYTFIKQPAGILTKIENKTLQIAHLIQRIRNFMLRRLVETSDVHVANARPNQEVQVNAVAGNFVANHRELERFIRAFAQDGDVNRGPFRPFQQISHVACAHVVGWFAIHGYENENNQEECATRTKDHLQFPSVLGIKKANYRPERSITCSKRSHSGVLDLSNHRD